MNRRQFLTAASATTATAALAAAAAPFAQAADEVQHPRQLIELRIYHFASSAKQQAFEQFLAQAAIPAFNRAGVDPVGVLKLMAKDNAALKLTADPTDLYVLLTHKSLDSVLQFETRLAADDAFQQVGRSILRAPMSDPAFKRYESTLMLAFESWPQVKPPAASPDRLLQLRTYESHSNERAITKIQMFQKGGEIRIFQRCGMNPVFFGQSLSGAKLPNLTYMLAFENQAALDKGWKAFRGDPDWQTLSKDDTYKDTVSNITNLILRPSSGSQI
ncbi:MAG TPA: NIPSNAP family protein [Tepidisphaeraceae bacterium]|jgi:hypothetical protein